MAGRSSADILRAVKARIEDRKHWTYNCAARDRHGHDVPPTDSRAVRWCAVGAFYVEMAGCSQAPKDALWLFLEQSLGRTSLASVNDLRGHQAVMQVYDQAIRLAEAAEGGQP